MPRQLRPTSDEEAAASLAGAAGGGEAVRIVGGGTKLGWGATVPHPPSSCTPSGSLGSLEHNDGDLTAVLEAGVPLARAQESFAQPGRCSRSTRPSGPGTRRRSAGSSPPATAARCATATARRATSSSG